MPFWTVCPTCERRLKATDTVRDRKIRCPSCGNPFVAQAEPAASAAPAPAPPRAATPQPDLEDEFELEAVAPSPPPKRPAPASPPRKASPPIEPLPEDDETEVMEPPPRVARRPAPPKPEDDEELAELEDAEEIPPPRATRATTPNKPVRRAERAEDEPWEEPVKRTIWDSSFILAAGALFGLLLLYAVGAMVFWIEDKAIKTALSLQQGAALARTVSAEQADPGNNAKLVHLHGEAAVTAPVLDPDFGISAQALRLVREVEVYQWLEHKEEKKVESKKGGKKEVTTVTTYRYTRDWSKDKPRATSTFHDPKGHQNPPDKPYPDATFKAREVKLGGFTLSPEQIDRLSATDDLIVTKDTLTSLPVPLKELAQPTTEGLLFVAMQSGNSPDEPAVGDVRIRYRVAKPQPITVVAKQAQSTFEPYIPAGGEKIDLLRPGVHTVQEMFQSAQSGTEMGAWLFRVLGFVLLVAGLYLILRRHRAVTSGRPVRGFLLKSGMWLVAAGIAAGVVLVVVGWRWVMQEPVVGGGLLGGGAVVFLLGILGGRGLRARPGSTPVTEEEEEDEEVSRKPPAAPAGKAPTLVLLGCLLVALAGALTVFFLAQGSSAATTPGQGRAAATAETSKEQSAAIGKATTSGNKEAGARPALRLQELAHVHIANSKGLLDLNRDFTIEIRARWNSEDRRVLYLAGDEAWPGMSPEIEVAQPCGWVLRTRPEKDDLVTLDFTVGAEVPGDPKGEWVAAKGAPSAIPPGWQHLAVCRAGPAIQLYWNGKLHAFLPCGDRRFLPAPTDLYIGPREHAYKGRAFAGEVSAFRLSAVARYTKDFTPPEQFEPDQETLLLLNFTVGTGTQIPDLAGGNRSGQIKGGEWVQLPPP